MTRNQIEFQKLKEDIRHNKTSEAVASLSQAETARHNYADEGIQRSGVQETARHNVQTENINWYSAQNTAQLQGAQAVYQRAAANTQVAQQGVLSAEEELKLEQAASELPKRMLNYAQAKVSLNQAETEKAKLEETSARALESAAKASELRAQTKEALARADEAIARAKAIPKQTDIERKNAETREKEYQQNWFKIGGEVVGNAFKGIGALAGLAR
jgi:hypothetical protein